MSLLSGTVAGQPKASADIKDAAGKTVGEAILEQRDDAVQISATFNDLPSGPHAFHIHEVGTCDPPFESAGGHLNPTSRQHGFEATTGAHAGDLPNLVVPSSGEVKAEILARDVRLSAASGTALLDDDGSSLVLHEKADDHKTDPAGNSGARIACGIVARPETH